jgi:protocatechuate 3,4-dioxygenase, alpha subunit
VSAARTRPPLTASQTVGPFFHDCLMREGARCDVLAGPEAVGARVRVEGRVTDGDGAAVPDVVLELWQANAFGRYDHPADQRDLPLDPALTGYGRVATGEDGTYCFTTVKPGAVPFEGGREQAPHVNVAVLGRGLLNHLYTRLYFDDEPATADDPVLQRVPAERRATLVARRAGADADGTAVYRFDVALQGADETVFFDFAAR